VGSVASWGPDGVLSAGAATFTADGALAVPLLHATALAGDVDAQNHHVSHALLNHATLDAPTVTNGMEVAGTLRLAAVAGAGALGTDAEGRVGPVTALDLPSLAASTEVVVKAGAVLKMEGLGEGTIMIEKDIKHLLLVDLPHFCLFVCVRGSLGGG